MNAVVYARYSSERQNEKSIEDQIQACEEYAKANDLNIIKIYMDKAKSGKNDNRPGFQRMLADSKERKFKVVLCWKLDRIGRNAADYFINEKTLLNNGVKIESITEMIPEGAAGPIIKGVYVGQAESYNINLALNVLRGMEGNAKQAKSNGGVCPYGLKVEKDRSYSIDEDTAPFVRDIFNQFVYEGKSFYQLAEYLNRHGQVNNKGNKFSGGYIKRILQNEKYKGVYKFAGIVQEDALPAIIEPELFDRAQQIINGYSKSYTPRKKPENFMLLGKLYCGICGEALVADGGTGKSGKVYRYYACKKRKKKAENCETKSIRKDILDQFVIDMTKKHVLQDNIIEVIADYAMKLQAESEEQNHVNKIKKDIKENQLQIDNLMKLLMQGWASDELRIQLMTLEEKKKSLKTALTLAEMNTEVLDRDFIVWTLNKYKEIEGYDSKLAREMVSTLINSIVIDNNYITIIYNYGENKKDTQTFSLEMLKCSNKLHMVDRRKINLNFENRYFYLKVFRSAA